MKKYLLVDARNLLWRCGYVHQSLTSRGVPTGALYGFLTTLLSIKNLYGGKTYIAWEGKGENFRKSIYPEYKKPTDDPHVLAMREDLNRQEKELKKILKACGVLQYRGMNCEADDVMATLINKKFKKGKVAIYSNDADLRQLVNKRISVVSAGPMADTVYDRKKVVERHFVTPEQIPDLKALMGDSSDGYPGVKGVGPKTAALLIQGFGNIRNVLDAAKTGQGWPISERFRFLIKDDPKLVKAFYKLAVIKNDVQLIKLKRKPDEDKLRKLLGYWQLRSLEKRVADLMALGVK
jgi:DNA polymerase-1